MRYGLQEALIGEIIDIAKKNRINKLVLFGSRARGDYKERSDIDLACMGGDGASFLIETEEDTSTLLKFDIVNMDNPVQKELLDSIEREGIVIYEKV